MFVFVEDIQNRNDVIRREIMEQILQLMIEYNYFFDMMLKAKAKNPMWGEYFRCRNQCRRIDKKMNDKIAFLG